MRQQRAGKIATENLANPAPRVPKIWMPKQLLEFLLTDQWMSRQADGVG
jgi:hypothetical protein